MAVKNKHIDEVPEDIRLDTGKPKKKEGRPRVEIDLEEAEKLGALQCTYEECEAWLGIPMGTLSSRPDFTEAYKRGKEKGKMSLRRLMLQHAQTSHAMAIFLSKNLLGFKDIPDPKEEKVAEVVVRMIPHKLADDSADNNHNGEQQ